MSDAKPDTPSSDHLAMADHWRLVSDLMNGAAAMRAAGERYLPKFARERNEDYEYRRKNAKYVGIYPDIVETLAAKPFDRKLTIVESSASPDVRALAEDIDGAGNNLHVFAQRLFFAGINDAVSWILIDYPNIGPDVVSVADEKKNLARPYWVHIAADRMLEVRSDLDGAKEIFTYVRMLEVNTTRDGFGEKTTRRVRILIRDKGDDGKWSPARWELWELQTNTNATSQWSLIDGGPFSVGVITLVPFIAGRRKGGWQFVPPLGNAATLQVEHFQAESALKNIKDQVAYPMLSGNGVNPEVGPHGEPPLLLVGPRSVLYAPMNADGKAGSWSYVEPEGRSLQFLADDIKRLEQQLRELGRQPLTAQTGNLTVVTTAFAASKANSVISAWALNLKDALEQALMFTTWWLRGDPQEPQVDIGTEFEVFVDDKVGPETMLKMREAGDISQETLWFEMKRRGLLAPDFDAKRELERLLKETPGGDDEFEGDNVLPIRPRATT